MGKWVTLSLVAAASLGLVSSAVATVPNAGLSRVSCGCVADPAGGASTMLPYKCTISPSGGSGTWINNEDIITVVDVRNALNSGLDGSSVVVTATDIPTSVSIWDPGPPVFGDIAEQPQTGLTSGGGFFTAKHDEGGINHNQGGGVNYPNLDMTVTAEPVGGGTPVALNGCDVLTDQLSVTSYDLNADCKVDLLDLVTFGGQYGGGVVPRIADFNWSGGPPDLLDLILFGKNYGANCDFN
jgi:hypothetical protein